MISLSLSVPTKRFSILILSAIIAILNFSQAKAYKVTNLLDNTDDKTLWLIQESNLTLTAGENTIGIPIPANGIFVALVKGQTFSIAEKLFF